MYSKTFLAAVLCGTAALGAPPDVPKEIKAKAGQVVFITLKSDAQVGYHAPFGSDIATFEEVVTNAKEERKFLFQAPADAPDGAYPITFWTAGETRGVSTVIVVTALGPGPAPPGPPQPPTPPVKPEPPKPPAPDKITPVQLVVVVVEETGDAAAGRGAFFRDKPLTDRLQAKGHKWAAFDKDVIDNTTGKPPEDKAYYLKLAAGKGFPQVFLVEAKTGVVRYQGDMPGTPAELLALIQKYGG